MLRLVKPFQMQTSLPPPIPNPRETPVQRVKQKGEMFRPRFLPTLLGMLVFCLIVWYVILYPAVLVLFRLVQVQRELFSSKSQKVWQLSYLAVLLDQQLFISCSPCALQKFLCTDKTLGAFLQLSRGTKLRKCNLSIFAA